MKAGYRSFLVQWQTLVISTSRSFWRELEKESDWSVTMVAPHAFREGGMQDMDCAANDPRNPPLVVLPVKRWHTQAVLFKGLTKTLLHWVKSYPSQKVFLSFTEPYALTAFFAWISLLISRILYFGRSQRPLFFVYGFQNLYKNFSLPIRLIQCLMFKVCDGILVAGNEHESVLRKHGFTGPCLTLPMWYDREIFFPSPSTESSSKIRIGYAGSLLPEKGIQQVLAHLLEHPLEIQECEFVIVGSGALTETIKQQSSQLERNGIKSSFLGPLPAAKMADFYRSIDILMVPSRTAPHWKEQFGRVIIEAMACGAVVIGSDSGEIPVVIHHPQYIFPETDLAKFLKVLTHAVGTVKQQRSTIRKDVSAAIALRYSDIEVAKKFKLDLDQFVQKHGLPSS